MVPVQAWSINSALATDPLADQEALGSLLFLCGLSLLARGRIGCWPPILVIVLRFRFRAMSLFKLDFKREPRINSKITVAVAAMSWVHLHLT